MGRLFWKIFIGFWLALVVAAVGAGTAVWLQHRAQQQQPPDLAAGPPSRMTVDLAAATLRHGGLEALKQWIAEVHSRRGAILFAVDDAGRDVIGREVPQAALASAREVAAHSEENRGGARHIAAPDGTQYLIFVTRPPGPMPRGPGGRPPPEPPIAPWEFVVIGLATSLAFSMLLAWYLARPIRNLRWAFGEAAAGHLETRVSPRMGRRRDEIADLGRDFDRMAQQLQMLVSAQRRLLHDVSHELRSPLARLHAAIGLARQEPAKLEATLERIEREATRLDSMVGEVLALARLESGTASRAKERVDLAYIAASIAEDARFEAEMLKRGVRFSASGDAPVMGNADLLHRAVENIVRNAIKFTKEGTTVEVQVHTTRTAAILSVTDHGPGITPSELEKVFDPFYRGESGQGTAGFGLGLAIAQRAVDAHGGAIRAANVVGGGLQVEVELPLAHG
ncbi:MAG: HAMP domain-containing protein [Betaproteobacteria bacterium]|nr:HAMP domain-containing protein [Betaproteobacteria bacterium]MBV9361639.1 HAMP domain-containing protein [Betaproteobacteria bacterium]